jgi:hypothetical protein
MNHAGKSIPIPPSLADAGSRLLPASIPFRYFGAAVVFHIAAWIALVAGADGMPRFAGGLGWPLAALHLVTLGVLVMTAIGASLQLLPVATRRSVGAARWPAAIWWVYTPGVAAAAMGMGTGIVALLAAGGAAIVFALAIYAMLLVRNLIGAKGMPVVVAHGWGALASLVVVLATAASLAGVYVGVPGFTRGTAVDLHVVFAVYGFMGMLVLGLSYILVPMFALSPAPGDRPGLASLAFAVAALLLAGAAAFGIASQLSHIVALVAGTVAVAMHLRLMTNALATGLRRALGRSFRLVRIAWGCLVASLGLAPGIILDAPFEGIDTLFGLIVVGGWLLTLLLGILQRIVPFLASMHAGRDAQGAKRRLPTPSSLTAERPLALHFACHLVALALLSLAVIADSAVAAQLGALVGTVGAVAFASFFVIAMRRMASPAPVTNPRAAPAA